MILVKADFMISEEWGTQQFNLSWNRMVAFHFSEEKNALIKGGMAISVTKYQLQLVGQQYLFCILDVGDHFLRGVGQNHTLF